MSSFKTARSVALIAHESGSISDEELLLLLGQVDSRNPDFSYDLYERFDLDNMEEAECKAEFRFNKNDIPILADVLGLPNIIKCHQRSIADRNEGLCMLLKRMAYPCRYSDMMYRFGRSVPEMSMIVNQVIDYIYETHGHLVTEWNNQLLHPVALQSYADAIHRNGAALDNCFVFVDGTVCSICRPTKHQRFVYNGHKRVHSIKFQAVSIPTGLIAHVYGPVGM